MKNSESDDIYHKIMGIKCDPSEFRSTDFDSLKKSLQFEVNSTRALYYIQDVKDLMLILRKRALTESLKKEAFQSVLSFVEVRASKDEKPLPKQLPPLVIDLIATKIGYGWIDLSRYLGLQDHDIEEIEARHPVQLKQRAYQAVLQFSREGRSMKETKEILFNALTKVRRIDIRNEVEESLNGSN